ncbi:hypothetical protein [Pseudodesulfovibrio senegalensis]|uniref:Uncharacterized protein n=1 Tax=Pseudodesulfovibrio senegalensis TaxID=1721087 RepID=A0A6N6MYM8_9BACT|nr:hypothetical protein [Pseudodesulfovibrio senegalensis]KAB1440346.1 hypothetical protein F8A88_13940 [Pseudodesulfovibrio senegalensis]
MAKTKITFEMNGKEICSFDWLDENLYIKDGKMGFMSELEPPRNYLTDDEKRIVSVVIEHADEEGYYLGSREEFRRLVSPQPVDYDILEAIYNVEISFENIDEPVRPLTGFQWYKVSEASEKDPEVILSVDERFVGLLKGYCSK